MKAYMETWPFKSCICAIAIMATELVWRALKEILPAVTRNKLYKIILGKKSNQTKTKLLETEQE